MNGTDPKEKTKDVPSDTDEDDVEDDDIIQEESKRLEINGFPHNPSIPETADDQATSARTPS